MQQAGTTIIFSLYLSCSFLTAAASIGAGRSQHQLRSIALSTYLLSQSVSQSVAGKQSNELLAVAIRLCFLNSVSSLTIIGGEILTKEIRTGKDFFRHSVVVVRSWARAVSPSFSTNGHCNFLERRRRRRLAETSSERASGGSGFLAPPATSPL